MCRVATSDRKNTSLALWRGASLVRRRRRDDREERERRWRRRNTIMKRRRIGLK